MSVTVKLHQAEQVRAKDITGISHPYARLVLTGLWQSPPQLFCFRVQHRTLHPTWNEEATFTVYRDEWEDIGVAIDLFNFRRGSQLRGQDRFLGRLQEPLSNFFVDGQSRRDAETLPLAPRSKRSHVSGTITVSVNSHDPNMLSNLSHKRRSRSIEQRDRVQSFLSEDEIGTARTRRTSSPAPIHVPLPSDVKVKSTIKLQRWFRLRRKKSSQLKKLFSQKQDFHVAELSHSRNGEIELRDPRKLFEQYIPKVKKHLQSTYMMLFIV